MTLLVDGRLLPLFNSKDYKGIFFCYIFFFLQKPLEQSDVYLSLLRHLYEHRCPKSGWQRAWLFSLSPLKFFVSLGPKGRRKGVCFLCPPLVYKRHSWNSMVCSVAFVCTIISLLKERPMSSVQRYCIEDYVGAVFLCSRPNLINTYICLKFRPLCYKHRHQVTSMSHFLLSNWLGKDRCLSVRLCSNAIG